MCISHHLLRARITTGASSKGLFRSVLSNAQATLTDLVCSSFTERVRNAPSPARRAPTLP